jgi:hypothetical protein
MNSDELNHPFFIYPRGFMSEYNYYELYRTEVKKLNEFVDKLFIEINEQQRDKEVLVSLIVGSAMEERLINSNTSINNYFQYHQLFPNYINNFIENNSNNKFIQIIIVSPDNIFMSPSNVPYFTLYEPFDFVLTNTNEYIYSNDRINIRINIFNCPFPCVEKRNDITMNYDTLIKNLEFNPYGISSFIQTQYDIEFIEHFYFNLEKLFSLSPDLGIKIIINSWVSFKNLSKYSDNYNMFPKLLELSNKYNLIATEWDFIDELFYARIISDYKFGNIKFKGININYAFDEVLTNLPENVLSMNFRYTNLFLIDFNSNFHLKKIIFYT